MKEKRLTQTQQVINTLREQGGYATLGNLYHLVDTSTWATKTPNESIRRIVNGESPIHIFHYWHRPAHRWRCHRCYPHGRVSTGVIM